MVVNSVADVGAASQGRRERAREIVEAGAVSRRSLWRDEWSVASQTGEGGYLVVYGGSGRYGCECRDHELHRGLDGFACKHVLAVRLYEAGTMDADEARDWARRWMPAAFGRDAAASMFVVMPRSLAIRLARETSRAQTEAAYWGGA